MTKHAAFRWSGGDSPFLDTPDVTCCGQVVVGRYGGSIAAGAQKNEDAALVWAASNGTWTFAALLDAHGSSQSADLMLGRVAEIEADIARVLEGAAESDAGDTPFWRLSDLIARHFTDDDFRRACASVRGETALLLCAQKGAYLWWLSIGDIPVYVFHPDFARLGQFALNQRMFFEWIGEANTFALPVPCYTTGVCQLRPGRSRILLTTDGLLECGLRLFDEPRALYSLFCSRADDQDVAGAVCDALEQVPARKGRDSATLIPWDVALTGDNRTMQPSA